MFEPKEVVSRLPETPGVYRFYNEQDELIYVGKAKSIRKRVASYFNKQAGVNRKTLRLVSEIRRIDYTVSNTEFDALLLENNFIKQNQPKYNILLKDDKTFPYICILRERFRPRRGRAGGGSNDVRRCRFLPARRYHGESRPRLHGSQS